jgi:hypothetical protein
MAAIRGKMGLHMGHLDGCSHKTKGNSTGSMDELFRNIGAEKTNGNTILGKSRSYLPVSCGSDRFEFFQYF